MMKSIFRGLEVRKRESAIKEGLSSELMTCVKSVQYDRTQEPTVAGGGDSEAALCTVLEAIFMHGLKETLADRMSSMLGDPDLRPSPEFWSLLMIFSHSEMIKQINQFSQITTDIGRSRAWLRLALNEGLLTSYFSMIARENSALIPFYKKAAFLRDLDCLGTSVEVLQGLNRFTFCLPVNSSMLNSWPNAPLLLAGLWTPPMKEVPVSLGTDIVKGIVETGLDADETLSVASLPSSSGGRQLLYEEEEALKIILGTPIDGSPLQSRLDRQEAEAAREDEPPPQNTSELHPQDSTAVTEGEEEPQRAEPQEVSSNLTNEEDKEEINSTLESYHKIIDTIQESNSEIQLANLQDIIAKFNPRKERSPQSPSKESPKTTKEKSFNLEDFEVIEEASVVGSLPEFKFLVHQMAKLMHEKGLIEQNFACKDCGQLIGFSFAKAFVCGLTGCYYCKDCFKGSEVCLPAKILHNWDFAKYSVSGRAAAFLTDLREFPLFDLRRINPRLYLFYPEALGLQKLRLQLNYIRGYVFTCPDRFKERLKQILWPREYLYEHVHLYAIADLLEIPIGKLEETLKEAIRLSTEHILGCPLCSQKGYICEVCKEGKVIYPFDIDTTYRCTSCRTVYHLHCRQELCPKCERIKKRKAASQSANQSLN